MSFSVLQMNLLRRYFLVLNFFHHSVKYGESLSTDDGTSKLALCPGDILIYNCTLMGTPGGVTVWQGEAFDCQNSEISLLHGLFTSQDGATGECNDGDIVARSLGVEDNHYTSQLRVTVSTAITGKTITCVYDTSSGNSLPQFNITIPTLITDAGPQPPPNNVHVSVANFVSGELTFAWSPVLHHCSSSISYSILALNCGHCPTNTTSTTVTCTDAPTNDTVCTFAVQTVLSGTIVGNSSEQVTVTTIRTADQTTHRDISSLLTIIAGGVMLFTAVLLILGFLLYKLSRRQNIRLPHFLRRGARNIASSNRDTRELQEETLNTLYGERIFDNRSSGNYTYCALEETTALNLNSLLHKFQGQLPTSQWLQFGLALGVPREVLNSLQHYSEKDRLVEMLDYWLKNHSAQPGPTWKEVNDAKRKAEFYQLAHNNGFSDKDVTSAETPPQKPPRRRSSVNKPQLKCSGDAHMYDRTSHIPIRPHGQQ